MSSFHPKTTLLLPCVYLGPVQWYVHFLSAEEVFIELHEHYLKQTWRNRCRIAGPNGVTDLVIPVHINGNHTPVKDVRIDYHNNWQQQHRRSVKAAYANAPYFDYYAEKLIPFFEKQSWKFLADFNRELLTVTLQLLKKEKAFSVTEVFEKTPPGKTDLRKAISPKQDFRDDNHFHPQRYIQVFEERHGFQPNLSIIDVLFCCGPEAAKIIGSSCPETPAGG